MEFDYSKVRGRIAEKGLTQEGLAECIGVTPVTLTSRMHNRSEWRQSEIYKAAAVLGIADEEIKKYFFTPLVKKP